MRIYISDLSLGMIQDIRKKTDGGSIDFNPNVLYPYAHTGSGSNNVELRKLIDVSGEGYYDSLMLDSGTYVMHQKEIKENIKFDYNNGANKYIDFVSIVGKFLDFYINYDVSYGYVEDGLVIPYNQEFNTHYQELLESKGLNPIYVMHSVSYEEFKYILDKKYKFVSISSAILNSKDFEQANKIVSKLYDKGIKAHLLGCASYNRLKNTKAWSCDASTYGRWASFGKMIYFSENEGREIRLSISEFNSKDEPNKDYYLLRKNQKYVLEYEDYIYPALGLTVDSIVGDVTGGNLLQANAYYMYTLENKINKIQLDKGIDFSGF
ncbi:hypothetical protein IKO50_05660 [bacterium]|nr:hypothetical protein [bacterium]